MPAKPTTAAQVGGYRFLVRRLEHALVRWDPRLLHDPMRAHSRAFAVGLVLAIVAVAGCAVYGLIRPQGAVGDARIVMARNSGALYVVIDGTLHPTLNLASARLVTDSSASPKAVADKKLRGYPRGTTLGIPGAPAALPGQPDAGTSAWLVCDTVDENASATSHAPNVSVIASRPELGRDMRAAGLDEAVLVRAPSDSTSADAGTYLLHGDRRSRVDVDDPVIRSTLRLDGAQPRPVSVGLLNTFREAPPIAVPRIADRGAPAVVRGRDIAVGSVVRVSALGGGTDYYVVFADGVQRVGLLAAELLRNSDSGGAVDVPTVAPAELSGLPVVEHLAVQDFPSVPPRLASSEDNVTCLAWERGIDRDTASAGLLLGSQLPLPAGATMVRPASAGGGVTDQVYVTPGSGRYVQSTGSEPGSRRAESLFYVTDSGVRHGVADLPTGKMLGLGEEPGPVPSSVIALLPGGADLSRSAALVSHDGIAPDRSGAAFEPPSRN